MTTPFIDLDRHPLGDPAYRSRSRSRLDSTGALVLEEFFTTDTVARALAESQDREEEAFYARTTHNVYLTPSDPALDPRHPFNRQVTSSKGLIADDQIPENSPLRAVYEDPEFRDCLCAVLGISQIHPYADALSSINVHFAAAGHELGWHFDNSSFAVTMLLQAPTAGGVFEFVPDVREHTGEMAFDRVAAVLDGETTPERLEFSPGDLVLFRGRNALHRVTPTEGSATRILVVFAFNEEPEVGLSDSALTTFFGRTG